MVRKIFSEVALEAARNEERIEKWKRIFLNLESILKNNIEIINLNQDTQRLILQKIEKLRSHDPQNKSLDKKDSRLSGIEDIHRSELNGIGSDNIFASLSRVGIYCEVTAKKAMNMFPDQCSEAAIECEDHIKALEILTEDLGKKWNATEQKIDICNAHIRRFNWNLDSGFYGSADTFYECQGQLSQNFAERDQLYSQLGICFQDIYEQLEHINTQVTAIGHLQDQISLRAGPPGFDFKSLPDRQP